jgi:hypothetical protein
VLTNLFHLYLFTEAFLYFFIFVLLPLKGISSNVIDDLSYAYQNGLSNKLLAVNEISQGSTNHHLGDFTYAMFSKTVTEVSSIKTRLYLGDMVFENDLFLFAGYEEGRIRKATNGSVAYDYFIKDHLGNPRMVLTDESNTQYYRTLSAKGGSDREVKSQNAIWDDAAGNSIDIINRRVNRPGNFGTMGTKGNYALSITKNTGV